MARRKILSKADLDRITEATRQAESKTSGEILTVIANRSGSYTGRVIVVGLVGLVIFSLAYLTFLPAAGHFLRRFFWDFQARHALWTLLVGQAAVFLIIYGLFSLIPGLKSLIISRRDKDDKVRHRAESSFFRHHITSTKGGTGVLVFISLFERRVELLVDAAIAGEIPKQTWQGVVRGIVAGIKNKRFVDDLCAQVIHVGEILSKDFPRRAGDVNELPDRPVVE